MAEIFEKLTTHSRGALKNAIGLAQNANHRAITPTHLLYGLSAERGSVAAHILHKAGANASMVEETLKHSAASNTISFSALTATTRRILEKSFFIASTYGHHYVGTEHLLAALLELPDESLEKFSREQNINVNSIKQQIEIILQSTSRFPDFTNFGFFTEDDRADAKGPLAATRQPSILEQYAVNLTDATIQKKIDPVIGRQTEIERMIQILSRRNKNNPLLLGDPGVGKTAIVEGLAKKIATGDVPHVLRDKKIYSLDLSLVVAGTSFRGEFENRLKLLLAEIKQDQSIILFIDEIHNIIGIGSASGSMDAANILKPALARGEIRCIGATTNEEYKKYIESDPALERRFQPIAVNQPSVDETISILEGVRDNYELFHGVKISRAAITAAAHLADRYIADRFLPDKAIDLIDEAASATKIRQLANQGNEYKLVADLEQQLKTLSKRKNEAIGQEKYRQALRLREQEQILLENLTLQKNDQKKTTGREIPTLTDQDIAQIISASTGIPINDIVLEEQKYLLNLEQELAKSIIGQDQAIQAVAELVRRSRTGIAARNRPSGSFMFLGPSGVGKTELARVLAEKVFGSKECLIKIDMSEFSESFNISKLIGAPAGYVGYKETTKLTDAVKRRPYSVVLFDEIDKAHRQIFHLLLQVLEDGYLTDATGKKIDFRNTIVIMTSNVGSSEFASQTALGFATNTLPVATEVHFADIERSVKAQVKEKFPPEFLSRLDHVIVFKPLSASAISAITGLQLGILAQRLDQQGIKLTFDQEVTNHIAKAGYSPTLGAREIRKHIQETVEGKIAKKLLLAKNRRPRQLALSIKNGALTV